MTTLPIATLHAPYLSARAQVCEKLVKLAISGTAQLKSKAEEKPGNKVSCLAASVSRGFVACTWSSTALGTSLPAQCSRLL